MQNLSTLSDGGGFLHANPAEKYCVQQTVVWQQTQETCAGKTVSTDKLKSSSGIIRSGKGAKNKSQFRTIAPKMVPKVITSRMVSGALPEQTNPISTASSKPLIMPTQNYALMQVAGHEGTFSLVALPHITPALIAQQIQQSNVLPPENLKLPIPRYQSLKSKLLIDKKTIQTSSSSAYNKILTKAQISSQTPAITTSTGDLSETHSTTDSSEQVILIDHGSTEITFATLLNENNCVESGSPLLNKTDTAKDSILGPCFVKEPLSKPMSASNPVKFNLHSTKSAIETTKGSVIMSKKLKEKLVNSSNSVTVPSLAVFDNEVQLTPSAPKGKLPILPYSRMKNAMFCKSKQNSDTAAAPAPGRRPECEKIPSLVKTFNVSTRVYDKLLAISFAQVSKQATCENTFCPATKLDVDNLKKLNGVATKRRGRKRRTPDDIYAFQTKRRKCIINKFRDGKERVKVDPQEPKNRKAESVKKYRSIRPKPVVVMQALAPLTSAAIIETQTPDSIEQEMFLNDSHPNKYLSYKQSDGTSAKPSDLCRNVFSTVPKLWHKCHVCNHNFQFKHHLQDHMNTHTNRRPYSCRICHKAYVHSGSLSTHMKLHHSEGRLKKLVCCEFCAKVFGHARVYFGHLKEVHRVVISTESSTSEQQLQDALKNRNVNIKGAEETIERGNKCNFEDLFQSQSDVKLQIKCGRCQFTAQTFAQMKFHLLCFHGEEIQGRIKEGIRQGDKGAQEELIKHAAHFWKCKERRNPVKHGTCEEAFYTFPKLKRQIYLHQNNFDILTKSEIIQSGNGELGKELQNIGCATQNKKIQIWCKAGYNCILCKQVFGRKEELFSHWQNHHNCEDPSVLWTIFNSFSKQGIIELSNNAEK